MMFLLYMIHVFLQTTEAVDVYSFGHVLYEMTFGSPLNIASKDDFPHTIPPPISKYQISCSTLSFYKKKRMLPQIMTPSTQ